MKHININIQSVDPKQLAKMLHDIINTNVDRYYIINIIGKEDNDYITRAEVDEMLKPKKNKKLKLLEGVDDENN